MTFRILTSALLLSLGLTGFAKELPEGTVISAKNLDQIMDDTFEGTKIRDLLTEKFQMWVRDYALTMKLGHSHPLKVDPAYDAATEKYKGQPKLNQDKTVSNYTAGIPFTDVDPNDPDCGWKLAWDNFYANPILGNSWIALGDVKIYDAHRGEIDHFEAWSAKSIFEGRTRGEPRIGSPTDHARYLLVLTQPYDIAGIGVFTKQYNNGRPDDGWAYVKALRRVRRIAGGKSWMDPQPKMDLLNDDNQAVLGYPGWFKSWQCKGKRKILAVTTAKDPNIPYTFADAVKEDEFPHWNPKGLIWEPKDVYVVVGIPPDEHPYSKKVLYMDAKYPFYYHSELYDRKGQFWRIWRESYAPITTCDGAPGYGFTHTMAIDFQNERATYIRIGLNKLNCLSPEFFNPNVLKKAASGALAEEAKKL
jgi:hypothetical protein